MNAEMPFLTNAATVPTDDEGAAGAPLLAEKEGPPRAANEIQLQTWIHRVTRQDEAAFSALYEACLGRVYGLALRITRHAALAEEVAEDAFWQIWREAPRFDPARGTATAWLLTITRSRALDSLRARDPAKLVEDVSEIADGHDSRAGPVDLLSATQSDQTLHQALAQLEAEPRQLIALAFFKGLTHDEIAAHTGIPLGTVKSHIRKGLTKLKSILGDAAGQRPEGI
jgi:RNA polymerase sigma factor (sigma-70 family)